jgi:uncharacterized membrane protein
MEWALFSDAGLLFVLRWFHILAGVAWIGMLWFFNFAQGPFMNEVDAPVKTAVNSKLAPRTLWYFRWGAMLTFLTGWALISIMASKFPGYITSSRGIIIMSGALMGTLMWFNVWFVIWPRQKLIIAAAQGGPAVENGPAVARRAFLASRTNTLLSIPLLFMMAGGVHLPVFVGPSASIGLWFVILVAILALLEINALKATNGATTKPIEKVKGVIHMGVLLTVVLYVLLEVLL